MGKTFGITLPIPEQVSDIVKKRIKDLATAPEDKEVGSVLIRTYRFGAHQTNYANQQLVVEFDGTAVRVISSTSLFDACARDIEHRFKPAKRKRK